MQICVLEQPVQGDADIAQIGALIGDPARARVLTALTDGRALPASRLAAEAGVAPSTVSEHLARLLAAGLVTVRPEGRSRFYRLASPEVADALEAISRISPPQPIRSLRQGSRARALREARTCYNHLAGRLGVGLLAGLLDGGLLSGGDGRYHPERAVADRLSAPGRDLSYRLTPRGEAVLGEIGVDLDAVLARQPGLPLLPGLVRAAPPPGRPAGHGPGRPAVRAGLGAAHRPAPGGPGHRRGPGEPADDPRARARLGPARPGQPPAHRLVVDLALGSCMKIGPVRMISEPGLSRSVSSRGGPA